MVDSIDHTAMEGRVVIICGEAIPLEGRCVAAAGWENHFSSCVIVRLLYGHGGSDCHLIMVDAIKWWVLIAGISSIDLMRGPLD